MRHIFIISLRSIPGVLGNSDTQQEGRRTSWKPMEPCGRSWNDMEHHGKSDGRFWKDWTWNSYSNGTLWNVIEGHGRSWNFWNIPWDSCVLRYIINSPALLRRRDPPLTFWYLLLPGQTSHQRDSSLAEESYLLYL